MKIFKIIIIFFIIFSCKTKSQENAKIISPNENLKYGNSLKYILENSTNSNELSTDIIANLSVKNLKFISTNDKIYIIDSLTKKVRGRTAADVNGSLASPHGIIYSLQYNNRIKAQAREALLQEGKATLFGDSWAPGAMRQSQLLSFDE